MVVHPSRRAADDLHVVAESLEIVAISHMRCRELNGDIGGRKLRAVEVLLVVDINDTNDFVTSAKGYFFYHLAHLAVTY